MPKTIQALQASLQATDARQAEPQRCEPCKATSGPALEIRVRRDTALVRLHRRGRFLDVLQLDEDEAEDLLLEVVCACVSLAGPPSSDDVPPYPLELGVVVEGTRKKKVCGQRVMEIFWGIRLKHIYTSQFRILAEPLG